MSAFTDQLDNLTSAFKSIPVPTISNLKSTIPAPKVIPDNSTASIVKNTIAGIPKATVDVAKSIGQGIARSVGTVGITAGNMPTKIANTITGAKTPLPFPSTIPTNQNPISNALFGGEPIRDIGSASANAADKANALASSIVGHPVKPVGTLAGAPLALGGILLDLSGFGGGEAVKAGSDLIPEAFLKYVAKESNPAMLENTLKNVGLDEANSRALSQHLAPTKTVDEVKNVLSNYKGPQNVASKIPLTGNETPQEIMALAEQNAAQKHLKFDQNGQPLAYTAREQAIVNKPNAQSLPELPKIVPRVKTTAPLENNSSNNSTTNKVNYQITGETPKERIQSAITNSERAKNELVSTGQDAYSIGNKINPAEFIKIRDAYQMGTPIKDIAKNSSNPTIVENYLNKLKHYYDLELASDRAAGGTTEKFQDYLPHYWDLSKPEDLAKFNNFAVQKGLQPYDGFRSQPKVFSSYAEGEYYGFTPKNNNINEDLKEHYGTASNTISKQVLKKGLQEAVPKMVSKSGYGKTITGKPYVNSNVPGLEGLSYDPFVHNQLGGYQPRTDANVFDVIKENETKTPAQIWNAVKQTGGLDTVASLYDKGNDALKTMILNLSGFHSINISLSYAGHALFADPLRGITGIARSIGAMVNEKYTQKLIEGYKKDIVKGKDYSVYDAGLRSGVNMKRELNPKGAAKYNPLTQSSHLIFDRELHILKLETTKMAFGNGKINPESVKGRAIGKEINMLMGEMNTYTQNINPNTQKWLSRVLLAPQFTESKFQMVGDAATKWKKNSGGSFARKAVIGKSIIMGLISTFSTLLATGQFPTLKQIALNATIDPGTQTNLTNPKGQKLDIKYPKTFISETSGLFTDPVQYGMNRLSPALSTGIKLITGKDSFGNPLVNPNKKESSAKQYIKNIGQGFLPIGGQAILNAAEGKSTPEQAAINVAGLQTKVNANDPTVLKYKAIDDAKTAIGNIAPDDPKRTEKIQAIYNDSNLTAQQKKSLNYQLLLDNVSTKGVLPSDAGKLKPLYDQLQQMKTDGKVNEANDIWSKLSKTDKVLYSKIKTYYKRVGTDQAEKDFTPTFQEIRQLKLDGDPQADTRYNALSPKEKHMYQLLKKQNL